MLLATSGFDGLVREQARWKGYVEPRLVTVEHPLGGVAPSEVLRRAESATEQVLKLLRG